MQSLIYLPFLLPFVPSPPHFDSNRVRRSHPSLSILISTSIYTYMYTHSALFCSSLPLLCTLLHALFSLLPFLAWVHSVVHVQPSTLLVKPSDYLCNKYEEPCSCTAPNTSFASIHIESLMHTAGAMILKACLMRYCTL